MTSSEKLRLRSGEFVVGKGIVAEQALRELHRAVAAATSVDGVMTSIADALVDHLGASTARVYFADSDRRELRLAAHRNVPSELVADLVRVSFDDPEPAGRAATARELVVLRGGALRANAAGASTAGVLIGAPLLAGDRVIGAISAAMPNGLETIDVDRLTALPDLLGALLDRAALRAELADRRRFDALTAPPLRAVAVAFDQAFELAWLLDARGVVVDVNAAAAEYFGPSARAQRDCRFWDGALWADDAVRVNVRSLVAQAASGAAASGEVEVVRAGERGAWLDLTVKPIASENGHASLLVAEARDVTDRRRAEEALRENEERMRLILQHSQVTVTLQDEKMRYTWIHAARDVQMRVLGRTDADILEPENAAMVVATKRRVLATGEPARIELDHVRDGRDVTLEVMIHPMRDSSGRTTGIVCATIDISERKKAEREREELLRRVAAEQRWLKTMVEAAPIGIVLFQANGRGELALNPRALEILGPDFSDIVDDVDRVAHYFRYPNGDPMPSSELVRARLQRGDVVVGEELLVRRPDGAELHLLVNSSPVRDENGSLMGAVLLFDDISALKRFQQLRDEWTHIVAHDLKQPLAAIQMHTKLLSRRDATGQLSPIITHIESSAELLARMISDLEDVSIIETRDVPLARAPLDLPKLLASVVQRAQVRMPSRPVRLEVLGAPPPVACDPLRIEQVVGNLLANAQKYGFDATEIVVTLETAERDVIVTVANQGVGIPAAERERVFERFHRVPGSPRGKGLGLGLYISKGLVEAHGGRIWAESEPGRTTRVRFTLPLPAT